MAEPQDQVLQRHEEVITIHSYLSSVLDSPPSCVEFVPRDNIAHQYQFVVGTYSLDTGENTESVDRGPPQTRTGSLQLFSLNDREL